MKKSKEFIVAHMFGMAEIRYLNGQVARTICYEKFLKYFGIELERGEKKRIKITIEEIK